MGNIITFLRSIQDGEEAVVDQKFAIFLDFENTVEQEDELARGLEDKFAPLPALLEFLATYAPGGQKVMQEAASNPGDSEVVDKAWDTMVPLVHNLLKLKQATDNLNQVVPDILGLMWDRQEGRDSNAHLHIFTKYTDLVIQLGRILDIDMRIDALKMSAPSIPNDISYVKRQVNIRQKDHKATETDTQYAETLTIQNLESISMFYINPTPALKSIIDITTQFFKTAESKDGPLGLIVSFCKVCIKILDTDIRSKFQNFGTLQMIHRIMVATSLLYDHLTPDGVFVKESPINIRLVVELLEDEAGIKRRRTRSRGAVNPDTGDQDHDAAEGLAEQARNLLNVLKYSNKHLKDPSTPKSVEQLFNKII